MIGIAKRAGVKTINIVRRSEQKDELLQLGCGAPASCPSPNPTSCPVTSCHAHDGVGHSAASLWSQASRAGRACTPHQASAAAGELGGALVRSLKLCSRS